MTTPFHNTITTPDNSIMSLSWKPNLERDENKKLQQEFIQNFAKKIREIRLRKELTQRQVAELAGLHESYYGHVELKRFKPSLFVAWKIAQALDTPLSQLTNL